MDVDAWFRAQGWEPFAFQREVWQAYLEGESGLIHSATGTGKTYAAWIAPLLEAQRSDAANGLRVLWITPLRALSSDTEQSLRFAAEGLGVPWRIESRTGDTSSAERAKQTKKQPQALVTTPESLTILLSRSDHPDLFAHLHLVVVDEWHEFMASKRGVQAELALARLRSLRPGLRTWGISATLGNLAQARDTLLGVGGKGRLIQGVSDKEVLIDTVLPRTVDRLPWAGHFGTQMIPAVIEAIETSGTCLVFTNTRAQAEAWYQQILEARPDWRTVIGLHHGSLDRNVRDEVEMGLKEGRLRAVVCTSSLDLGVDFSPVDRVLQVGSPKGVARLLQRAGRSGHQPGAVSRVTCVPTHAFELVDIAAARKAAEAGRIEAREGVRGPLDVLAQHLVTVAAGLGFQEDALYDEVKQTVSYQNLTRQEWDWCMDFVVRGGSSLQAYPEYRRVELRDGRYRIAHEDIARRHRMSIGTIVSDAAMNVQLVGGGRLGTVEESFLSRLRPGERFVFAGRALQFVRIKDMTAWVRRTSRVDGAIPRWAGGRLPLSNELSRAIRQELELAKSGIRDGPEMQYLEPILQLQSEWSVIPAESELLIERVESREGRHLFFFPFEGRLVHEGLAALFAYRMSRILPITFTMACNDYGFELLSPDVAPLDEAIEGGLLSPENLSEDIAASLNSVEMAKRQFREVARIAGLVFQGYPGMGKSAKQIQASSNLFYDVFARYDPSNLLLHQAQKEVLERQLEQSRMAETLKRLQGSRLVVTEPPRPTPMAFPILVDRLRETLSSESLADRIAQMTQESSAS